MASARVLEPGRISAILGPTNTGKTHRAIERMLAYESGMMGLPLRLLAREVYDRVVAARGADAVALVTGEEKILPSQARFFVCTVEAMPVDRPVAFLCVDEVQLAGDANRGHVFTDRLLNARGVRETLFLGSDTIEPLLTELLPGLQVETQPRLSMLTHVGPRKVLAVPKRSAIVAFSAVRVYELAEQLRAAHGGAAVVLGALSPRTRNAQVGMYQAGEVQHMVATDAIGMGLNMDLEHVAFSALSKYDGRRQRDLTTAEIAQIAGRAGRYTTDGTFGTTRSAGELEAAVVADVEAHRFVPLARLYWRNSDLDFSSGEALLHSLSRPPPSPRLIPCQHEIDHLALEDVLANREVADRVADEASVRRLWEICRVPDYRKTLTGSHAELLIELALHLLSADGHLPDSWVGQRLERLDRVEGDIDTLMGRIAYVRTWTTVAHHRDWTGRPEHWQARARAIEDRLSDALHERLTQRFVDRRVMLVLGGQAAKAHLELTDDGAVRLGGLDVGSVTNASFTPGQGAKGRGVVNAVRRRLRSEVLPRLQQLLSDPDDALQLEADGGLAWQGWTLARLRPGDGVLTPRIKLLRLDLLHPDEREQLRVRLAGWVARWVEGLFSPLSRGSTDALTPPARGLLYQLREGLGCVPRDQVEESVRALSSDDRGTLAKLDVRIGTRTVYVHSLLRRAPMRTRAALWSVDRGRYPLLDPPSEGRTSVVVDGVAKGLLVAVGFEIVGAVAVRVDTLEKVAAKLRSMAHSRDGEPLTPLMSWLGAGREATEHVVRGLGYRLRSVDEERVMVRRMRPGGGQRR